MDHKCPWFHWYILKLRQILMLSVKNFNLKTRAQKLQSHTSYFMSKWPKYLIRIIKGGKVSFYFYFSYVFMHVYMCVCMYVFMQLCMYVSIYMLCESHSIYIEVRRQHVKVCTLLPPCMSQESYSLCQSRQQLPLSSNFSWQLGNVYFGL